MKNEVTHLRKNVNSHGIPVIQQGGGILLNYQLVITAPSVSYWFTA